MSIPIERFLLSLVMVLCLPAHAGDLKPVEQRFWAPETAQKVDPRLLRALFDDQTLLLAVSNHLLGDIRPMLVLFDPSLDELWAVDLGDARFEFGQTSAIELQDGNLLLAAIAQQTIRLQAHDRTTGVLLWDRTVPHHTEAGSDPPAMTEDPVSGDLLVAATDAGTLRVHRFDSSGEPGLVLTVDDSGLDHSPSDMVPLPNATFALVTRTGSTGSGDYRTFILDSKGSVTGMDVETGSFGGIQTGAWLYPDPLGGVRVLAGPESTCGVFESWLWRLDSNAQRIWTQVLPETDPCHGAKPIGLAPAPGHGLYIGSDRTGGAALQRIDADGKRRWVSGSSGLTEGSFVPHGLAAVASHHAIIVGNESIPGSGGMTRPAAVIWNSDGTPCVSAPLSDSGSVRHVVAESDGRWLAALHARDAKDRLTVDLRRYEVPPQCQEIPPGSDLVFEDGFEALP